MVPNAVPPPSTRGFRGLGRIVEFPLPGQGGDAAITMRRPAAAFKRQPAPGGLRRRRRRSDRAGFYPKTTLIFLNKNLLVSSRWHGLNPYRHRPKGRSNAP